MCGCKKVTNMRYVHKDKAHSLRGHNLPDRVLPTPKSVLRCCAWGQRSWELRWLGKKTFIVCHFPVASLLLQWNPQNTQVSRLCNQGDKVSADSVGSPENRCGLLGSLKTMSSSSSSRHGWKHYDCGTSKVGKKCFCFWEPIFFRRNFPNIEKEFFDTIWPLSSPYRTQLLPFAESLSYSGIDFPNLAQFP